MYNLSIVAAIDGWRLLYPDDPQIIVSYGMTNLDGIYKTFQNIIWAEKEIKENAVLFDSKWGNSMGVVTANDEIVHLGQKMGFKIVIRKDPSKGYIRIKALPEKTIDLTDIYKKLQEKDPDATWFLHASRHMILNGSSKSPEMKPTTLTMDQIIDILKLK